MTKLADTRVSFDEAIAEALRLEMYRDPTIVCVFSSPSGVAARVAEGFPAERALRTADVGAPLILAAGGIAAEGLRPVCELRLDEIGAGGLEQLAELAVSAAAAAGPTPLTIRIEVGNPLADGGAAGADPLGFLLGRGGLKIVEPSDAADAKGLTVAAIRDDDPVCVLEHASLRNVVDAVPEGAHQVEIGHGRWVTEGSRITLVAHGTGVAVARDVIEARGLDADLIDLRTIEPLDKDLVLASVRKTGKVVIVEPAGDGGRIRVALAAAIWEGAFEYLDAPTGRVRLGGPEDGPGADAERLLAACEELLAY